MNDDQVARVARDLFDAFDAKQPFEPLAGAARPDSLEIAYRIQNSVYDLMGTAGGLGSRGGHKIALTSKAIQQLVGLDKPIYGAMFASQIYSTGHAINLGDYVRLGLEFEVGVRLAADVPTSSESYTKDTIAPFVHSCMPAFELIEDRAADYSQLDAFSILADRCWCAGTVLGEPITAWSDLDLSACSVQMVCNGEVLEQATTGEAMGHPFNGLAWVANYLNSVGRTLKKDEVVITGSALKTYFGKPGDTISYQIAGLGEVSVTRS